MKNILSVLFVLCSITVAAQHRVSQKIERLNSLNTNFQFVEPLSEVSAPVNRPDNIVSDATYVKLNEALVKKVFIEKHEFMELSIPFANNDITLQLYKVNISSQDFIVKTDKATTGLAYMPGSYYRGIVKGNSESVAAFSFFENELYGIVSIPQIGNIVIGRLAIEGNRENYIIYNDKDILIPQHYECSTPDTNTNGNKRHLKNAMDVQSEHCVSLYFELRQNAYLANGSSVTQTTNWFTAMFNNVQTLFDNDGISTAIKSIYVWTEADPYNLATPSAYGLLEQFAQQTPVFDADAGQLISANMGNGLAYGIGTLCSDQNRSYAKVSTSYQQVPAYSASVKIIAHELGHVFGSHHTHGCYWNGNNTAIDGCSTGEGDCQPGPIPGAEGGTIMSYCGNVNFANGFGTQPSARMLQHIASSACLGTDCLSSCTATITSLDLTDTTLYSATLSWNDSQASLWQVAYAPFGQEISQWQNTAQNSFTINNLNSNTYYTFCVRNICDEGVNAGGKYLSFSTGANWCSGEIWTDTGGADANYSGAQHTVTVIKPESDNQAVTVMFQDFWTQLQDVVYVYDGIGTSAPLLGTWSGYTPPSSPFTAGNATGALTFEFKTDPMVFPSEGWVASVECTLAANAVNFKELKYYPNPVNNVLTLDSPQVIDCVEIYNVAGQLLSYQQVNSLSCVLNMSLYAQGVYIVKVLQGKEISHLQIIKH